jgi:nicotinate dehydrogenase subunit B
MVTSAASNGVIDDRSPNSAAQTGGASPRSRPGQYKIVGKFFPRKDLPGKVFGQLEMVNDVRLPGMLHARMIRPPVAGSVPVTVDETSIANIPGAKVVRIKDVLAVVAEKEWYAVRAAERLKVTWSNSKPSFPGHDRLHDHIRRARVVERKVEDEHGSVDDAFRDAARIIEAEYEFPTQSHASLGPACAVADVRADGATLWTSTQKPHYARDGVAKLVGLPVEKVRAIWMFGTGSYGRNDQGDAGADAAVLSKELGRPVRVQYTRQQGLAWDPKGTATVCRSRAGIDAAGKVIAYEHTTKGFSRVNTSTNEGRPGATLAGQWMGAPLEPAQQHSVPHSSYKFDHQRLAWETIPPLLDRASPLRTTHLRDPHGASVLFGSECFMDELAASIASDPVEFRLRYLKHPRELAVVKAAAERAGWQARVSPRSDRTQGDIVIGRGIALRRHAESFIALIAEVRIERRSGRIQPVRYVCAADIGLVVNPGTLRHVIECQLVYGTSRAMFEEVRFDENMITSADWKTYPVLEIDSAPETIDVVLIDRPEQPSSGAAEMGPGLVAPAIGNAVFDATGVRLRRVPFTPERVKAALERA